MGEHHEAIQRELDTLEKHRAKITSHAPVVAHAEELKQEFPEMKLKISVDWEMSLDGVCLAWKMGKNDNMKQIEHVLRAAINKGYHPRKGKSFADYAPCRVRMYFYGKLKIECHVHWDSGAVCQYVKTGEKTEDVFEVQCKE